MIQVQTRLHVADNTGAKELLCIRVPKGNNRRYGRVGDEIVGSIKDATPQAVQEAKKGSVVRAVIVRTVKEYRRPDGSYIKFDDNAAVLLNLQGLPIGTRVFGPVARELRDKGYLRIVSLAPEVL